MVRDRLHGRLLSSSTSALSSSPPPSVAVWLKPGSGARGARALGRDGAGRTWSSRWRTPLGEAARGRAGKAEAGGQPLAGLLDRSAASRSGEAADEARRREAIMRPALVARLSGDLEQLEDRLRRNASWHARNCPAASAPPGEWRRAQRGPRLGARRPCGGAGLRADAEIFAPAGGVWEPLGCWEPRGPSAGQARGVRCFVRSRGILGRAGPVQRRR